MKNTFEFIPTEEKHLDQPVSLLASTDYWDFGLQYNNLKLSARELMREFVAKPNFQFTTITVKKDNHDIILGKVVCASKKETTEKNCNNCK